MDALRAAFMPGLIPNNFDERAAPVDLNNTVKLASEYSPFTKGYDLLGDESIIAVELPGHAIGQMGLFVRDSDDKLFFFVADAAWLKQAIHKNRPPLKIANLLFSDPQAYHETLSCLNQYYLNHPNVQIVPSHCEETISALSGATGGSKVEAP
jgi:glyoxylase-like metal-dependent hydrolase (beta-lactamase superfamily II)